MAKITRVGVDIGKSWFHVCAVTREGKVVWHGGLTRSRWLEELGKRIEPGTEVGLEACGGAHHWARVLRQRGYRVRLIAPQFVTPYVASNKTDSADAEAIAEAMSRPKMRFVAVKSVAQQDLQALHRVRAEVLKQRTAKANQIRGLLAEYGLVVVQTLSALRRAIAVWLADGENGLSEGFRVLLSGLQGDLQHLDARVKELNSQLERAAQRDGVARRLLQLQGVGPVNATALSAALGDGSAYRNGRDFAVSLGLTPRQHTTGGRERLLGISKRGDAYIRKQLVHGARAVIRHAKHKDDALSQWVNRLMLRRHTNVVTVALAAKTARIAWALVRRERDYDPTLAACSLV